MYNAMALCNLAGLGGAQGQGLASLSGLAGLGRLQSGIGGYPSSTFDSTVIEMESEVNELLKDWDK